VKTSDQPLFSSVSVSPFTSAEALRASDISLAPSLKLQPNTLGGIAKKIKVHLTVILLGEIRKGNQTGH
jgi:hypothetical protein